MPVGNAKMSINERSRLVIESQNLTVKDFAETVDPPLEQYITILIVAKSLVQNSFLKFLKNLILI